MLFNSVQFLFFFAIVTVLYFALPHKWRWLHLLLSSCVFYMYFIPVYILILFFTIVIDYVAGILIENATGSKRKWLLVMSIISNVGILMVFKYYNFFAGNINELLAVPGAAPSIPLLNIILPIGLSFHTFQAMSYPIEVYRDNQKAERHLGIYSLYVMFYPQLVAGPIERPQNMLHQFYERHNLEYDNVASGIRLMLWGFIKKVVIADRLAVTTDPIFNAPHEHSGIGLAIGAILFSFQIFCDFSGYSDIAIGAAKVMGFKLMTNFNMPYHSRTIGEFWKRWHISLSTWFRDYLYIPLGGNRVPVARIYFNLFLVFLISGFWHGANWTFIVWGALHGFYLVFAMLTSNVRRKVAGLLGLDRARGLNKLLNVSSTFCLVAFAWIFFRANNIGDALFIVRKLGSIPAELMRVIASRKVAFLNLPGIYNYLIPCFAAIFFLEIAHVVKVKFRLPDTFYKLPGVLRWSLYFLSLFVIVYLGVYEKRQFIYFQF